MTCSELLGALRRLRIRPPIIFCEKNYQNTITGMLKNNMKFDSLHYYPICFTKNRKEL